MLEAWLRSARARTAGAVVEAMGEALRAVRPGSPGRFAHGGHPTTPSNVTVNE